jgi:hypothetical protein
MILKKQTAQRLMQFVAVLSVIATAACTTTQIAATETVNEVCRQNGEALPTRSVSDTAQTRDEITRLYTTYALTCPAWVHLIPE